MSRLKYTLFLTLVGLFSLNSCKDDEANNPPPMLTTNGEMIKKDTIKHSTQDEYEAFVDIIDGNPPFIIDMDDNIPNVTVHQGLKQVEGTILTINDDNTTFTLKNFTRPADEDDIEITMDIEVSDKNFLRGETRLELTVLGNQSPKADLEIEILDDDGIDLSRKINGCGSIDGDAEYGGEIIKYRFTIVGEIDGEELFYLYEDNSCEIDFVFPGVGTYVISIEVMDNEDKWSEKIDTVFTIP